MSSLKYLRNTTKSLFNQPLRKFSIKHTFYAKDLEVREVETK